MIEAVGFFSSESQNLLGPRRKIIHWFGGSGAVPFSDSFASLVISGLGNTRKRSPVFSGAKWPPPPRFHFLLQPFLQRPRLRFDKKFADRQPPIFRKRAEVDAEFHDRQ